MIIDTTLTSYAIRLRCVQNYSTYKASISCYSADKRTHLLISFQVESEEVGTARIDSLPNGSRRVVVYFPMSMFGNIHRVLQTEKPILLNASDNNNYTQVSFGTGTDQLEPIGEEES